MGTLGLECYRGQIMQGSIRQDFLRFERRVNDSVEDAPDPFKYSPQSASTGTSQPAAAASTTAPQSAAATTSSTESSQPAASTSPSLSTIPVVLVAFTRLLRTQVALDAISVGFEPDDSHLVESLKFSGPKYPSLVEIAIVTLSVNSLAPRYNWAWQNCYWFVFAVSEYFKAVYDGHVTNMELSPTITLYGRQQQRLSKGCICNHCITLGHTWYPVQRIPEEYQEVYKDFEQTVFQLKHNALYREEKAQKEAAEAELRAEREKVKALERQLAVLVPHRQGQHI
ncbi:hypothetical protein AMATHDRAFT_7423 [Amanita thiersii Skay4041]|uniref:Uncharacterized protein n=1 Tax=Amanita thiersii Skay4041 TaxID=703135 RepID=A0A2A9NBQ5_9AGAR|nr:hypothetical protein AMATHDRAFT_7423 [Amanita thiersii Skay4041]